jgi:hypothetical protein
MIGNKSADSARLVLLGDILREYRRANAIIMDMRHCMSVKEWRAWMEHLAWRDYYDMKAAEYNNKVSALVTIPIRHFPLTYDV